MGTTNKTLSATVASAVDANNIFCMRNRVNITGLATGEVVQCLSIPAGTLVLWVLTRTVTAEASGACTGIVGDASGGGTNNDWDASIDLAATAGTVTASVAGTDAFCTAGKLYDTADTIDVTLTIASGPATSGVFEIMALCMAFPPITSVL